jgi:hypothetical protein
MQPNLNLISLDNNVDNIEEMLFQLVLNPRKDFIRWASITRQTPNMKIGYPGQHLASLVTGMEGERTGARGHDLRDGSEVKSCSRVDQLDKCKHCKAAVARIESSCPQCNSVNIKRNNDSKWLFSIRSEDELSYLIDDVPRIVLIIGDYPNYDEEDWETIQFQAFEIWPQHERHASFRTLMSNYFLNIYIKHIEENPRKTPAPKNFWPYSFQFYMCNPILVFHCIVTNASTKPAISVKQYVQPSIDRSTITPVPMPVEVLNASEKATLLRILGHKEFQLSAQNGLSVHQRECLELRDTDHATPQASSYRRGVRG